MLFVGDGIGFPPVSALDFLVFSLPSIFSEKVLCESVLFCWLSVCCLDCNVCCASPSSSAPGVPKSALLKARIANRGAGVSGASGIFALSVGCQVSNDKQAPCIRRPDVEWRAITNTNLRNTRTNCYRVMHTGISSSSHKPSKLSTGKTPYIGDMIYKTRMAETRCFCLHPRNPKGGDGETSGRGKVWHPFIPLFSQHLDSFLSSMLSPSIPLFLFDFPYLNYVYC